jgi:hypothetical protein
MSQTEVGDNPSVAGDLAELARCYPAPAVTVDQIDPISAAAVDNALTGCHLAVLGCWEERAERWGATLGEKRPRPVVVP